MVQALGVHFVHALMDIAVRHAKLSAWVGMQTHVQDTEPA
jgi:hypothetical protein